MRKTPRGSTKLGRTTVNINKSNRNRMKYVVTLEATLILLEAGLSTYIVADLLGLGRNIVKRISSGEWFNCFKVAKNGLNIIKDKDKLKRRKRCKTCGGYIKVFPCLLCKARNTYAQNSRSNC